MGGGGGGAGGGVGGGAGGGAGGGGEGAGGGDGGGCGTGGGGEGCGGDGGGGDGAAIMLFISTIGADACVTAARRMDETASSGCALMAARVVCASAASAAVRMRSSMSMMTEPARNLSTTSAARGKSEYNRERKAASSKVATSAATVKLADTTLR